MSVDLSQVFQEWNQSHFDGVLAEPRLIWHSRLRTSSGRFIPGKHLVRGWTKMTQPPQIEIARYLLELPNAHHHVRDTMGHEMIHYWLWERGRPYGHTAEFNRKLQAMGVSRYNPVPKFSGSMWVYVCPHCKRQWNRRRKYSRKVACQPCCKVHAGGKFSLDFVLVVLREPGEALTTVEPPATMNT